MPPDAAPSASVSAVQRSLAQVRYELVPLKGVEEHASALPEGATATITASPTKGLTATLELAERLRAERPDLVLVPHLAARLVRDRSHVAELRARIAALGADDVFVIAGDAETPVGRFASAVDLLHALAELGDPPARIGISGYPESHAFISDADTIRAMGEKAAYASYIVSQMCFDPQTITTWVRAVRARGVTLPIYLGVPGAVDRTRLMRVSMKVGLGESIRFLRKQHGALSRFVTGYSPDELVFGLEDLLGDPASRIAGWHLYTFNEVAKTERWRQDLLARVQGAHAS